MADLKANQPKIVIAGVTASFASLGIDATKAKEIYEEPAVANGTFKSFVATSGLNSLTGFTAGKGYLIYPNNDFTVESQEGGSEASFSDDVFVNPNAL